MRRLIVGKVTAFAALAGMSLSVSGRAGNQVTRSHASVTTETTNAQAARTPYTAEYKITHVQTLADGTTITRDTTEVKALDSQGRRMKAMTITSGGHAPSTHVMVFDPVAHSQTFWHSPGKIAYVFQASAGAAEHYCLPIARDDVVVASGPKAKYTSEDLGTESIQGIEARRRRRTTTIPTGAEGNDEPLVITSDRWTALTVGDGLLVREISDDPRHGKTTQELINLSPSEPDQTTFQPPEGYEIVTKESSGCHYEDPTTETRSKPTSPK
jgi:hypothetical protein